MPARRGFPEGDEKKGKISIDEVRYGIGGEGSDLDVIRENDLEDALRLKPKELRPWREMGLPFIQNEGANKRLYLIKDVMRFLDRIKTVLTKEREVDSNEVRT